MSDMKVHVSDRHTQQQIQVRGNLRHSSLCCGNPGKKPSFLFALTRHSCNRFFTLPSQQ